jgi:hypothetical protein
VLRQEVAVLRRHNPRLPLTYALREIRSHRVRAGSTLRGAPGWAVGCPGRRRDGVAATVPVTTGTSATRSP